MHTTPLHEREIQVSLLAKMAPYHFALKGGYVIIMIRMVPKLDFGLVNVLLDFSPTFKTISFKSSNHCYPIKWKHFDG